MEEKNDKWIKQTQMKIMNNIYSDCIKHDNIVKNVTANPEYQNNDGIDECINNKIENDYELAEANNAVKYTEYFVKRIKHIVDQNSAKPKDFDKWTIKEQYEHIVNNIEIYIPSIPDSLLFFIPAALYRGDCGRNSMDKPLWLNMEKFQRGQKFAQDHIFSIFFANMLSLFEIFAFADGLKPMIFSRQSHTPYLAFQRYLSTGRRVTNWMTEDPWTAGTKAHKDIETVRRMHRAVRKKLCQYENEEIDVATKIQKPWCPDRDMILEDFSFCPYPTVEKGCINLLITPKGLNQADMAATQFAFVGMVLLYPQELGIHASDEDMEAFCHTWRCIGYLLGMEDQYNFCRGSLEEVKQRSRDFIEVWVKPYLRQVTPEWEHMLRCIVEGGRYYIGNLTFKMFILCVTSLLNIDMPHLRSTLTFSERFKLILHRFIFRYAMKLRFVRQILNKIIHKAFNTAINFGPEKHQKLQKLSQQVLDKVR
ncbi:uncharacterized protein LOC105831183 [Monomorium pharaonis]|uniref:uncharacterized protein LOC105831183 n=1 Tax=Monomorium pharaonis TaxID=307658 RepID=UPI00063F0411|nr:uncharacterized protein LOC105831183 [Monomorium pharaonis]